MPAHRLLLPASCLVLLVIFQANAGAPSIEDICVDQKGRRVMTVYQPSRGAFAEAKPLPKSERNSATERGLSTYAIYVDPERYYLSRLSQRWLFLRQCAHIWSNNDILYKGESGLNIDQEEEADCWAVSELLKRDSRATTKTLYAIERDIERAAEEGRWREILPGPKRRIKVSSCR